MTVNVPTKERLIDKLRDELYKKHSWTGETAVKFMVPIILAIRYKDAEALAENTPEDDAILWALNEFRASGKRELDDTLNQVKTQYHGISPLLQGTLEGMIGFVTRQPDGIIFDVLDYLSRNEALLRALRDEDFIGSLFERSVSDAFRGDDGRFFTPRNVILIVREMMRLLVDKLQPERKIPEYTVCDPCCGSARFLIYWSEHIKNEIEKELRQQATVPRPQLLAELKETAEHTLFGADIHEDTAAYGCLNMLLHGDGATNIASLDSLDHFGFFANMPLLQEFAKEFQTEWDHYNNGPARQRDDIVPDLDIIEEKQAIVGDLLIAEEIDLSNPKWLDVMRVIRALLRADRKYPTEWDSVRAIQRRFKRRAVFEAMMDMWAHRNSDVANGFDIIITNPPFGRKPELQIDDPFILSQYKLATELWVQDMSKSMTEGLLSRTLAKDIGLSAYYVNLVERHFDRKYVLAIDEVRFSHLPAELLGTILEYHDLAPSGYIDRNALVQRIRRRLRRIVSERLKQDRALLEKTEPDYKQKDKELKKVAQDERNRIDRLTLAKLEKEVLAQGLSWTDILLKRELLATLTQALGREFVTEDDELLLSHLPSKEALRVCTEYLYDGNNPGEILACEIVAHFGGEWLTAEDIEGPDGYASKVPLVFNGEPHTVYYDDADTPIVYKNPLPKQVLFIEQFLRMVKEGGKVFTVLDTGVLSNIGDEYVRQFIYKNARVHTIVEFPHGAFKAAEANVKTAVVLLEKGEFNTDYEFFGSLPEHLGYRLNDQNVPPIPENDLGKVMCDYSIHLGLAPLLPECLGEGKTGVSAGSCPWYDTRSCIFWKKYVEREEM